jgi:hypothetical protein
MNQTKAFEVLGLRENDATTYSEYDIKKAYRTKILQYHPDKNNSPDATEKFIEVQDAYKFLQNNTDDSSSCDEPYNDILKSFLASVLREETPLISKLIELICKKICLVLEHNVDHIIDYLRNINRDTLKMIRGVLSKYKHILHFTSDIFERIDEILEVDEYIILNPTLDNLLSTDNIYILKHDSNSHLVPLWHHDMTFDHNGQNLVVKCFPILPDNMELDEWNVLTVRLQYNIGEIWKREIAVEVGGKMFCISGDRLRLTDQPQNIEYVECGVPYNNTENVLDDSKKQSIVFIVTLTYP